MSIRDRFSGADIVVFNGQRYYLRSGNIYDRAGVIQNSVTLSGFGSQSYIFFNDILFVPKTRNNQKVWSPAVADGYEFHTRAELFDAITLIHWSLSEGLAAYGPIYSWNVSAVTNMDGIFESGYRYTPTVLNKNIRSDDWVSIKLNRSTSRLDYIGTWDTSNVTSMKQMFKNVNRYSSRTCGFDLLNVSKVTNMEEMFYSDSIIPKTGWEIEMRGKTGYQVDNDPAVAAQFEDLSNWDVSSVTNTKKMFCNNTGLRFNLMNWNLSSLTDATDMLKNAGLIYMSRCNHFTDRVYYNHDYAVEKDYRPSFPASHYPPNSAQQVEEFYQTMTDTLINWKSKAINIPTTIKLPFFRGINSDLDSAVDNINNVDFTSRTVATREKIWKYINRGNSELAITPLVWYENRGDGVYYGPVGLWDTSSLTDISDPAGAASTHPSTPHLYFGTWISWSISDPGKLIFNESLEHWDTSRCKDFNRFFYSMEKFNMPINSWNMSSATNMFSMFNSLSGAFYASNRPETAEFNQDLSSWDTSNVTDMSSMFNKTVFNQPIGSWNTSNVTDMGRMFSENPKFNQPIGSWNTSKVTDMRNMFYYAEDFNQPIGSWNTSNVTDMRNMFDQVIDFNQPIGSWNTSKVTDMRNMFMNAFAFNQPLDSWDVSNVTSMEKMFKCYTLTDNQNEWNRSSKFNQSLNSWNTSKVTDMFWMFEGAVEFNGQVGNWDVSNVTVMGSMFAYCFRFNQPLANWRPSSCKHMTSMFRYASDFNQPLADWRDSVGLVTTMGSMFYECGKFNQSLQSWRTGSLKYTARMFQSAYQFKQSFVGWDYYDITQMDNMFLYNSKMTKALIPWFTGSGPPYS